MAGMFDKFDVLLLDIEGTVCPISFVKDVLFPYALEALPRLLDEQWNDPGFAPYRKAFPDEYHGSRQSFQTHVQDLVSRDVKAPYLKALQGYLWRTGYESGELKAPLFSDVSPFITQAHTVGKKIMIYSSGSVPAQKLFFAHTTSEPSDLSPLISDWFDTVNAGPKMDVASYVTILSQWPSIEPSRWLFLSDNLDEVNAAQQSGMCSIPVTRPGNSQLPFDHPQSSLAISTFTSESIISSLASIAEIGQGRI